MSIENEGKFTEFSLNRTDAYVDMSKLEKMLKRQYAETLMYGFLDYLGLVPRSESEVQLDGQQVTEKFDNFVSIQAETAEGMELDILKAFDLEMVKRFCTFQFKTTIGELIKSMEFEAEIREHVRDKVLYWEKARDLVDVTY